MRAVVAFTTLLAATLVGCDRKPSASSPTPTPTTPPPATQPADQSDLRTRTAELARDAAVEAQKKASEAASAAREVASDVAARAQALIDQASTYLGENKYELADKALTQAEQLTESLSQGMQQTVRSLRARLDAARARQAAAAPTTQPDQVK